MSRRRHGFALGAAHGGAGEVERGGAGGLAGDHELTRRGSERFELGGPGLELLDVLGLGGEVVGDRLAGGDGELRHDQVEAALEADRDVVGARRAGEGAAEADRAGGLVDGAEGFGLGMRLGDSPAAPQSGGAVVPRTGVVGHAASVPSGY